MKCYLYRLSDIKRGWFGPDRSMTFGYIGPVGFDGVLKGGNPMVVEFADKYPLLKSYFEDHSVVKQHLDSYNAFVSEGIHKIIENVGGVETNVEGFDIKFGQLRIEKPMIIEADGAQRTILPAEARLRNITYAAPLFLEMIPYVNGVEKKGATEVFIGELPVMLKSKLCHLENKTRSELIEAEEDPNDPGGYFIINGTEKVLVSIEDLAPNKLTVSREEQGERVISKVFSTRDGFRARCVVTRTKLGLLYLEFPMSPPNLIFTAVMKALGAKNNNKLLELFSDERVIRNDILLNLEHDPTKTQEEALEYLGKRAAPGQPEEFQLNRVNMLLDTYLLPHLGTDFEDREAKLYYLVEMAEKAILVGNRMMKPDDKDHYGNKRVKLAGTLMEELFRYAFQFLVRDIGYIASRADARGRRLLVHNIVRPDVLATRIKYGMSTGTWVGGQTGVSQLLDRTSYIYSLSHRRRLISPLAKKHPHFKARDLHGTHWGKICPYETPEGTSCSLVKNLALSVDVSIGEDPTEAERVLEELGVQKV